VRKSHLPDKRKSSIHRYAYTIVYLLFFYYLLEVNTRPQRLFSIAEPKPLCLMSTSFFTLGKYMVVKWKYTTYTYLDKYLARYIVIPNKKLEAASYTLYRRRGHHHHAL